MRDWMRARLTYANVMATLALFIALGGSSYAVVQYTGRNIKDSSLTTKDIKNRSLLKKDFRRGQLPAGKQGPRGDPGTSGDPGSAAAYVKVGPTGATIGDAKNVDRSTQVDTGGIPHPGEYCVHTTAAPKNLVASRLGTNPGYISVATADPPVHCNGLADPGWNVEVFTFDTTGAAANASFFLIVN